MSTLKVTNIQATGETASRAVSGVAAAWVSFNGTGTVAIEDSVNVSSVTDGGTGAYTSNFLSSMGNSVFKVGGVTHAAGVAYTSFSTTRATGSWALGIGPTDTFLVIDTNQNQTSVHGDLA